MVILGSDASPPFGLHIVITMALHREDDEMYSLGLVLVHQYAHRGRKARAIFTHNVYYLVVKNCKGRREKNPL